MKHAKLPPSQKDTFDLMHSWIHFSLIFVLFFLTACPASMPANRPVSPNTTFENAQPDTSARGGKTLFAVYMLGSDLEDDISPRDGVVDNNPTTGAASDDLKEMARGLEKLTPEERKNLDLLIAFGGARKQGWKGIKYMDADCLLEDVKDQHIGNASCYLKTNPNTNLARAESLKDFLGFLNTIYPAQNYGKRLLTLWNHGAAHVGYGPDKNFLGQAGVMTLENMREGLQAEPKGFDLIGFDACLMGNVDVMRQVHDKTQYMVASEELEPGHGWQYTDLLGFIGQQKNASVQEIGKHMVDSFMTHPDHANSGGKTLALLNTQTFPQFQAALNTVADRLQSGSYKAILEAARKTEQYGKNPRTKTAFTMDLYHFSERLLQGNLDAQPLQNALKDLIIYSRHDGLRPHAKGAGIFAMTNTSHFKEKLYTAQRAASEPWYDFVSSFIQEGLNDQEKPSLLRAPLNTAVDFQADKNERPQVDDQGEFGEFDGEDAETGFTTQQTEGLTCQDGRCFIADDNQGIAALYAVRMVEVAPHRYEVLSELPPLEVAVNVYRTPRWDGKSLYLCADLDCDPDESILVPLFFEDFSEDDTLFFYSEGQINGEDVTFYFEMDENREMLDTWAVPYDLDEESFEISKQQIELLPGDRVAFYVDEIDPRNDRLDTYALTPEITLGEFIDYQYLPPLGKTLVTFLLAEDLNDNYQISPPQIVTRQP